MVNLKENQSGSKVTYHISGSNSEVCLELTKLINWYVNSIFNGWIERFEFNPESKKCEAVFTREKW